MVIQNDERMYHTVGHYVDITLKYPAPSLSISLRINNR